MIFTRTFQHRGNTHSSGLFIPLPPAAARAYSSRSLEIVQRAGDTLPSLLEYVRVDHRGGHMVKMDESLDPINVTPFGVQRVMVPPHDLPHLVQESGILPLSVHGNGLPLSA